METVTASIFLSFISDPANELHTFFMIAESEQETNKILNRCKYRMDSRLQCCIFRCFCSCFRCCRPFWAYFIRLVLVYLSEGNLHSIEVYSYNVVATLSVSYVKRNNLIVSSVVLVSELDIVLSRVAVHAVLI